MTSEQIPLLQVGSYLMPVSGNPSSSIRIIDIGEQGFRFRRCHSYYNGEEFFLNKDALIKSNWVIVPAGIQLELL